MDDQNTPSEPIVETPVQTPEPAPTPVEPESSQPNGYTPIDLPSDAPESPISVPAPIPVESQNGGINQPESEVPEASILESVQASAPASAPALQTSPTPQPQSPAQQDQTGFIRALLAKAQAKIQSNKQKKLDKIIQYAQKKKIIANEDIHKLLHVSSATATRYLVKLVQQGRLARIGNPRDARYQFVR